MNDDQATVYPYIPNSVPRVKREMLHEVGAKSEEDFYEDVPEALRLKRPLNLPEPFLSECALKRHVEGILTRNKTCLEYLSFLGAGCYQHHVPAVCDEINQRSEFLTAYAGEPYDDHGRFQALFEYASMMGEVLNMDVVRRRQSTLRIPRILAISSCRETKSPRSSTTAARSVWWASIRSRWG